MTPAYSLYLDVVRFVAAVLVYLWHSNMEAIVPERVFAGGYGQSAVIAFFVLSGFVIAYVVETKESDWRRFTARRAARVFSVVLPVLLLTPVLDAAGRALAPAVYTAYPFDQFAARILGSLLLLNEVGPVSITFFSNVPYWSIAYEWWCYALFGLATFWPGRWRWAVVAGVALLLGPKILLLMPVWLAGVALYRWRWIAERSTGFYAALLVLSTLGIVGFHVLNMPAYGVALVRDAIGPAWTRELAFSKYFLTDYLLGALVWTNFAAMRAFAPRLLPLLLPMTQPIRAAASLTFTLYLLHQPAILFWTAVLRDMAPGWSKWWAVTAQMAVTVIAVGAVTEARRDRLRRWLERWLSRPAAPAPR